MAARETGASVLLLEKSNRVFRGGNSRHTRNVRYLHDSGNSFLTGPYLEQEFWDDLMRVTGGNTTENLARLVIRKSHNLGDWMTRHGCMFQPSMRGTLHLSRTNAFFLGGGRGLINNYFHTAEKMGVDVVYYAEVVGITMDGPEFKSATVKTPDRTFEVNARTVIAAAGGSQANLGFLAKHWGDAAKNFDDHAFALELMETEGVLVVPGSSFNVPYRHHFRVTLLPEAATMRDVFARIDRALSRRAEAATKVVPIKGKPRPAAA